MCPHYGGVHLSGVSTKRGSTVSTTCNISAISCMQLKPCDVEYSRYGITTSKLLKRAVLNTGYPPAITCAITYKEELRRTGRPVWVCLDLLGAGTELSFMCKAYEKADYQQLDGSRNGELEWTVEAAMTFEQLQPLQCDHSFLSSFTYAEYVLSVLLMCIASSPSP